MGTRYVPQNDNEWTCLHCGGGGQKGGRCAGCGCLEDTPDCLFKWRDRGEYSETGQLERA